MRALVTDARFQVVRNLLPSPRGGSYMTIGSRGPGGAATLTRIVADGPDGGAFARMAITTAPTGTSPTPYFTLGQTGSAAALAALTPGRTYTRTTWARSSIPGKWNLYLLLHRDIGGSGWYCIAINGVAASSAWAKYSASAVIPAGYYWARTVVELIPSRVPVVGDTIDAAAIVTGGPTAYKLADGDSPGWRWEGAAGASTSVGWARPA